MHRSEAHWPRKRVLPIPYLLQFRFATMANPKHPTQRNVLLVPVLMIAIFGAQCAWFVATQSLTADEPLHIMAGLNALRHGSFDLWNDHPPLGRILSAAPLLSYRPSLQITQTMPLAALFSDARAIQYRARALQVLLGIILGVALWLTTRYVWSRPRQDRTGEVAPGNGAAAIALALFAFSPSLIASFSLATTDGIGALTIFCSAAVLLWWRRRPSPARTGVMGLVLGVLLLAKFYTPPFFLLTLAFMVVLAPLSPSPDITRDRMFLPPSQLRRWRWGHAAAACFIALLTVWAGYFFHVTHVKIEDGHRVITYPHRPPIVKAAKSGDFSYWLPAGEYFEGLRAVRSHNAAGHPTYFLGKITDTGTKLYFPVLLALKCPALTLALVLATAVLLIARQLALSTDLCVLAVYPVVMMAMGIASHLQIGERHILPVYPFLLLFAGGTWAYIAPPRQPRRARLLAVLLIGVVAANALDALRYAPDYLAYFNPMVKNVDAWKIATDSNLDWGQGLIALRNYQQQHETETIHLAYSGSMRPEFYGVRVRPLEENDHATGTVVISATNLSGQYLKDPLAYRGLLSYRLKATLAHSLYVFDVPTAAEPSTSLK